MTPSAISQAIRALEARVGAALFIRTTRSVGLTEAAAERFSCRARNPPSRNSSPQARSRANSEAAGRTVTPLGAARGGAAPAGAADRLSFCQAYPEIELEIAASDEMVDLAAGGFDAGIRLGQFIEPDMTAVRLTRPIPRHGGRRQPGLFQRAEASRNASTICAATLACACAARMGQSRRGLLSTATRRSKQSSPGRSSRTTSPRSSERRSRVWDLRRCPARSPTAPIADGRLQALLTRFAVTTPGVFLYHPGKRQVLPKLRAFIEHVKYRSADAANKTRSHVDSGRTRARKGATVT